MNTHLLKALTRFSQNSQNKASFTPPGYKKKNIAPQKQKLVKQSQFFLHAKYSVIKILFILGLLSSNAVFAQDNAHALEPKPVLHTTFNITYYLDSSSKLSAKELTNVFYQKRFQALDSHYLTYTHFKKPLWFKLKRNATNSLEKKQGPSQTENEITISISANSYASVQLYIVDKNLITPIDKNTALSRGNKVIFLLNPSQAEKTILIKYLASIPGRIMIETNNDSFLKNSLQHVSHYFNSWVNGTLTLVMVYLFFFIQYRNSLYFYYLAILLTQTAFITGELGHLSAFIPDSLSYRYYELVDTLVNLSSTICYLFTIAASLFCIRYFKTQSKLHFAYQFIILASVCLLIISFAFELIGPATISIILLLSLLATVTITSILHWREPSKNGALFLCATLLMISLIIFTIVHSLGLYLTINTVTTVCMIANLTGSILMLIAIQKQQQTLIEQHSSKTKAIDLADASTKARSDFLVKISHEIRSPMNGILGMTELLLDTALTKIQKDYASTVYRSANSLLQVLNDILDYSRIESGTMELDIANFELSNLLTDTLNVFKSQAENRGIEIIINIEQDVPNNLQGDPIRLKQILNSLIENSIHNSASGVIIISVSKRSDSHAKLPLLFKISDSSYELQPQQPGAILEDTLTSESNDAQALLGLEIAEQLVRLMGGSIGIYKNEEKSKRHCHTLWFTVDLEEQESPMEDRGKVEVNLDNIKILIVDDNVICQQVIERQSLSWGMQAMTAQSGKEALALLRTADNLGDPFDIVAIDHIMPEMDGLSLAKKIAEDNNISSDPILIMLSGKSNSLPKHELEQLGIKKMLTKPIAGNVLRFALMEIWKEHSLSKKPTLINDGDHVSLSSGLSDIQN